MTRYIFGLILTLAVFSCKKDDTIPITPKKDYTSFLSQTTPKFSGMLDSVFISWTFGWNQSQSIAGYENGYGICDSTDPVRVVMFGLTSESDLTTRFTIYSPKYNSESDSDIARVFSVGKKKLGDFRNDFFLSIYKNDKIYQSNSLDPTSEIEILKTQEFTDNLGKKLRVWFKVDAKLSSCGCQEINAVLTDGLMTVEFYG